MSRELDVVLHFTFLTISLAVWFYRRRFLTERRFLFVGLFLLSTFIFDGLATIIMFNTYLQQVLENSNLFLYHIVTPIRFSLIMLFYYEEIRNPHIRKAILITIPAYVLMSAFLSLFVQEIQEYNVYQILVHHLLTTVAVLYYFYELVTIMPFVKVYTQPDFWISVAFLFHSVLNVLLEGFSNYLSTYSAEHYGVVYTLFSLSNYCLFILITLGFYLSGHKLNANNEDVSGNKR